MMEKIQEHSFNFSSKLKEDQSTWIVYNCIRMLDLFSPLITDESSFSKKELMKKMKVCEDYYSTKKEILEFFNLDIQASKQSKSKKLDFEEKMNKAFFEKFKKNKKMKKEEEIMKLDKQIESLKNDLELKNTIIEEQLQMAKRNEKKTKYKDMYEDTNKKLKSAMQELHATKPNMEKKDKIIKDLQHIQSTKQLQYNKQSTEIERLKKEVEKRSNELKCVKNESAKARNELKNEKNKIQKLKVGEKENRLIQKKEIIEKNEIISGLQIELENALMKRNQNYGTYIECSICAEDYNDLHTPVR